LNKCPLRCITPSALLGRVQNLCLLILHVASY
jgi:hypothetical protein